MGDDAIINIAAETVEDGQTGPLGDREKAHLIGPVASTIPSPTSPVEDAVLVGSTIRAGRQSSGPTVLRTSAGRARHG